MIDESGVESKLISKSGQWCLVCAREEFVKTGVP